MRKLLALTTAVLLLTAAACGDDDDSAAGSDEYVQAMVDSAMADDDFPFEEDEIECLATRFIGAIGVDTLEDAGVTPDDIRDEDSTLSDYDLDISERQARDMVGAFDRCGMALSDLFADETDVDLPSDLRGCIDDSLAESFVQQIIDDELEDFAFLSKLMEDCPDLAEFE